MAKNMNINTFKRSVQDFNRTIYTRSSKLNNIMNEMKFALEDAGYNNWEINGMLRDILDMASEVSKQKETTSKNKSGKTIKAMKGKSTLALTCADCGENIFSEDGRGNIKVIDVVCNDCHEATKSDHKTELEKNKSIIDKAKKKTAEAEKTINNAKAEVEKAKKETEKVKAENKKLKERIFKLENPLATVVTSDHSIL